MHPAAKQLSTSVVLALALSIPAGALADTPKQPRRITLAVTEKGFEPDKVVVKKGEPVVLVFTRKVEKTCTKEVVIRIDDKQKLEKKLPLNKPVEIAVTFPKAGELAYACAMNMDKGVITVR